MSWAAEPAGEGHTPLPSPGPPASSPLWPVSPRPASLSFDRPLAPRLPSTHCSPGAPKHNSAPCHLAPLPSAHMCVCARTPTHTHSIPSPLNRKRKLMETSQTMALRPPRGFAYAPNELSLLEHETVSEKILDPGPVPENHPSSPISALCQAKPWRGQGGDTTCHWPSWREAWSWRWAFPLPAPAQQRGAHSSPHWLLLPVASRLSQTSVPMNWGKPGSAVGHGGGCR